MFGYQIEEALKNFPEVHGHLKGLVSIDKIPKKLKKMQFLIINESNSDSQGTHWFLIFRELAGNYVLFDPLGLSDPL